MDYSYNYNYGTGGGAAGALFGACYGVFWLLIAAVVIAGMWRVFTKAGKPGWAAIIPIYNVIVLLEVVGRPIWWIVLLFIPFVNIVIEIMLMVDLAKSFGKSTGYAIGLIFLSPIFIPMLGFGSSTYVGPAAAMPFGGYYPQPGPGGYYPPQPPAGGGYYPPQPQSPYPPQPPTPPAYAPPAYAPPAPAAPPAPPAPPAYAPPAPPQPPVYAPPAPPVTPEPAAPAPETPPAAPAPETPPAPPAPPEAPQP